ncbi:efflux RND transporter periplasmic adaptor subunit [Occallatibacter riparius]|uniref:Efflux RND transporter periplasmic adaptor subunit n=1 Tax=Occallatibacter riparius TaxID=1002689 RepID=A0A9J7BKT1_9BACT|nr:efflux RND transporter periplasmic adaptor subunit [Occallatibacter riparius]UWZ83484.1 efflux RND transporter periplasmic adaptor subunit [Occallatibacter riparius]
MDAQSASNEGLPNRSAIGTPPPRRRRHRWIWAVVLLAFAALFYWVLHHEQKGQAAGPGAPGGGGGGRRGMMGGSVPVTTATAHSGSVGVYVDAIGTVTPLHTVSINAQVTGTITAVHYKEGQIVHQGDPLIDIDSRPFQAQVQQAEGTLERDQNVLAQAKMDLERYKLAWAKNAISKQTLDDQEKIVAQNEGLVKNDEGNVEYQKVQLSYCHIVSPLNGKVGLRLVDPGNLVTANSTTTLVVVTQEQPTTVVFTIAQDNLPQVLQQTRGSKGLRVDAFDRAQSGHLATGKLTSIDNQIDTTTGTVKLRAEFDNRDYALFPNQFVNTRLLVKTLDNQVLVPSSAIQHNGSQDFVYLIEKDPKGEKAVQHQVKSGISDHGDTAVQGINAGDEVADSSFEKLQNGSQIMRSKVKIPSTSEPAASSAP